MKSSAVIPEVRCAVVPPARQSLTAALLVIPRRPPSPPPQVRSNLNIRLPVWAQPLGAVVFAGTAVSFNEALTVQLLAVQLPVASVANPSDFFLGQRTLEPPLRPPHQVAGRPPLELHSDASVGVAPAAWAPL